MGYSPEVESPKPGWIPSRVGHVLYAYSIIVSRGSAWTGVNIAQSEFGSVVTKALEAQNDYGNKLQSSQSDFTFTFCFFGSLLTTPAWKTVLSDSEPMTKVS